MQQSVNLKNCRRNNDVFAFFLITRIIAIIFSFPCATDIGLYLDYSKKLLIFHLIPYKEFFLEYPPLTLVTISLPHLFIKTVSFNNYYFSFATIMFFVDCCTLQVCRIYCRDKLKMDGKEIRYFTTIYSLFGLLMFRIIYHRLDLLVALFLSLSLLLFNSKKPQLKISFFLNSFLGFFYKIIPAINVFLAIIFKAFNSNLSRKKIVTKIFLQSTIFTLALLAAICVLEIFTNHAFLQNLSMHKNRGIQLESSYASLIMFKNFLLEKISPIFHGNDGWNVAASDFVNFVAKFLGHCLLFLFYGAVFFVLLHKKNKQQKIFLSEENFLEATLILVLLFLAFQRVLSTQFFIWLIPLSTIWLAKNRSPIFLLVFSFLFFATFFIFSIDYFALTNESSISVITLFLRNVVLVIFTIFLIRKFFKNLLNNDR